MTELGEIETFKNKENKEIKQLLQSFLKKKLRIEIVDERVFVGDLVCFDK